MPVSPPPASGGSGGTGSLSYAGSYGGDSGGYGGGNPADYLRQLYEESLNAQLAALRAAYEQNTADYQAHDDLIAQVYRNQRNQAAAQNDLQRMYMAELGTAQGLNTGAAGQLALAQNAAHQGQLAELLAAEGQDRAENDLALRKLAADYRGDTASARAQNSTELLRALYSEAVRQEDVAREEAWRRQQMEYQRRQDALAQQNWQTQWDYSLQADARDSAYNLAITYLKNGILPDSATLAAAGISQESAAALAQAYRQDTAQSAKRSTGGGAAAPAAAQDYSGLFNAAYNSGYPASYISNNYKNYGFTSSSGLKDEYEQWSGDSGKLNTYLSNVNQIAAGGNPDALDGYLKSIWGKLSGREREQIQGLLKKHGFDGGYVPD